MRPGAGPRLRRDWIALAILTTVYLGVSLFVTQQLLPADADPGADLGGVGPVVESVLRLLAG